MLSQLKYQVGQRRSPFAGADPCAHRQRVESSRRTVDYRFFGSNHKRIKGIPDLRLEQERTSLGAMLVSRSRTSMPSSQFACPPCFAMWVWHTVHDQIQDEVDSASAVVSLLSLRFVFAFVRAGRSIRPDSRSWSPQVVHDSILIVRRIVRRVCAHVSRVCFDPTKMVIRRLPGFQAACRLFGGSHSRFPGDLLDPSPHRRVRREGLKFHVTRYCTRCTAATAMCNASRG